MGPKKLLRSNENKMICGVCGGIGEYFNMDPTPLWSTQRQLKLWRA